MGFTGSLSAGPMRVAAPVRGLYPVGKGCRSVKRARNRPDRRSRCALDRRLEVPSAVGPGAAEDPHRARVSRDPGDDERHAAPTSLEDPEHVAPRPWPESDVEHGAAELHSRALRRPVVPDPHREPRSAAEDGSGCTFAAARRLAVGVQSHRGEQPRVASRACVASGIARQEGFAHGNDPLRPAALARLPRRSDACGGVDGDDARNRRPPRCRPATAGSSARNRRRA